MDDVAEKTGPSMVVANPERPFVAGDRAVATQRLNSGRGPLGPSRPQRLLMRERNATQRSRDLVPSKATQ